MKKYAILLIVVIMALAPASCGSGDTTGQQQQTDAPSEEAITVTIDISYPDESGLADVEDATVTVDSESSVLNALITYGNANDIEVLTDESSENPYVTSINGVAETDTAGWVYEVNDEMVMESADACILTDGDSISWDFESWTE